MIDSEIRNSGEGLGCGFFQNSQQASPSEKVYTNGDAEHSWFIGNP